jgi:divalent metal cation (Fe/Co/Zn/Cd) transporter
LAEALPEPARSQPGEKEARITASALSVHRAPNTLQPTGSSPHRLALALSYVTVGYNVLEGGLSIVFARVAGSPALLGFGIDSFVESLSGAVMVWRFSHKSDSADDERRERTAIRLVGASLIVLAAYVAYEAAKSIYFDNPPERSVAGLAIAALSLVVMPTLYLLKRRTAAAIGSRSLAADARQTLACMLLSAALLVGTGLHYTIGWWQADPLAGLLIAAYLVREGYEAWIEQDLCRGCS